MGGCVSTPPSTFPSQNLKVAHSEEVKERPIFLQSRAEPAPAYKTEFKPQMKVLARKPPPKIAARSDAAGAMGKLNLQDDEDSDEEDRKKAALEFEERKARAIREREEKQRKYQEVRDKIFGASDDAKRPPSSGDVSSRNSSRGKGRGAKQEKEPRGGGGSGSGDQSPAHHSAQRKQLFDPSYTEKPTSAFVQRRANAESGRSTPNEERPIRAPRGPDGSGRGGFGFAPRGGKSASAA
jgi:hypothetical protein